MVLGMIVVSPSKKHPIGEWMVELVYERKMERSGGETLFLHRKVNELIYTENKGRILTRRL